MTFATFERILTSAHIVILAVLGLVAIVGVCLGAWHQLLVAGGCALMVWTLIKDRKAEKGGAE